MITKTIKYLQLKDLYDNNLIPQMFNECNYEFNDPRLEFFDLDAIIKNGWFNELVVGLITTFEYSYNKNRESVITNDKMNFILANYCYGLDGLYTLQGQSKNDVNNYDAICKKYKLHEAYFELEDYYDLKQSIKEHKPYGFFSYITDKEHYKYESEEFKEKYEKNKEGIDKLIEYINDETIDFNEIVKKLNVDTKSFLNKNELEENKKNSYG